MSDRTEELKTFAEAMLDVERLKIVGALARGNGQVAVLAENAGVTVESALAHLEVLSRTGIVTLQAQPEGEHTYQFDGKALEEMSRRQFMRARALSNREPDQREIGSAFSKEEAKYIRSFTNRKGVITHLPSLNKKPKLLAVLRYAMQDLEAQRVYTEAEFNQALSRFTRDASSVRRYLVDWGFVERKIDGSAYWLKEGSDD